ncbi:MAG: hypothetical protein WDW36_008141 [Sanguina aurantia]
MGSKKRKAESASGEKKAPRPSGVAQKLTKSKDLYEAHDDDADEVKHARRFDDVENYEYEQPSDMEDEEIDEDNAFTAEDKKKYGAWFGDGDDGDTDDDDEGQDGGGEDDLGSYDDEELEEAEADVDADAEGSAGEEGEEEDGGLDEVDAIFGAALGEEDGDGDDAGEAEGDGEGEGEEDPTGTRYRDLLNTALGRGAGGVGLPKRGTPTPRGLRSGGAAQVLSEAFPESEYNVNPGAATEAPRAWVDMHDGEVRRRLPAPARQVMTTSTGVTVLYGCATFPSRAPPWYRERPSDGSGPPSELTIDALMRGLGKSRRKLGPARKLLEKMAVGKGGTAPVAAPLPRAVRERQERKAGYEKSAEELSRWQGLVKANREAPTIRFTAARDEVSRLETTAAIVSQFQADPGNEMESEVAALLEAAGAANSAAVEQAERALVAKSLTAEEARERRQRLAKMRALLFHHEIKAKRMAAIKSKEYHRQASRAAKRKARKEAEAGIGEEGEEGAKLAARRQQEEAEFVRAKERLTLKHRNTSKWARRALKRGVTVMDEGTKAALAEQVALGRTLRRKMEGGAGDETSSSGGSSSTDSSGGGDDDDSGNDMDGGGREGGGGRTAAARPSSSKARAAAMQILAGSGAAEGDGGPAKGLMALPFMARAMERQRLAAQQEASAVLAEMQAQDEGEAGAGDGLGGPSGFEFGVSEPAVPVSRRRFSGVPALAPAAGAVPGLGSGDGSEDEEAEDAQAKAERLGTLLQEQVRAEGGSGAAAASRPARRAGNTTRVLSSTTSARAAGRVSRDGSAAAPHHDSPEDGSDSGHEGRPAHLTTRSAQAPLANGSSWSDGVRDATRRQLLSQAAAAPVSVAGAGAPPLVAKRVSVASQQPGRGEGGSPGPTFLPASTFAGSKPGFAFRKGAQGLGYYEDKRQAPPTPAAAAAPAHAGEPAAAAAAPKDSTHRRPAARAQPARSVGGDDSDEDGENGGAGHVMQARPSSQSAQLDLVRAAFAGDDVEAEFEADKAEDVAGELPSDKTAAALPGWGSWGSQGPSRRETAIAKLAADKAKRDRERAAAARQDASLRNVVLSEKWDKKAAKYTAVSVPFPFDNKEVYERSIRQPLGREYNPDESFRHLTRPAVIKATGVMIQPARFSKALAKEAISSKSREGRHIAIVAGGMNSKRKK